MVVEDPLDGAVLNRVVAKDAVLIVAVTIGWPIGAIISRARARMRLDALRRTEGNERR